MVVPRCRAGSASRSHTRAVPPAALMTAAFKNLIGGQWVEPATGAYVENRNPADWKGNLIGRFPRSGAEDVACAAESARRGFAQWSRTPAPVRGQVLQRIGDLLVRDKER